MPNLHRLYRAGHATIVHARRHPIAIAPISMGRTCSKAALPVRAMPDTGWLNRALAALEPADAPPRARIRPLRRAGRAPRGARPAPMLSWAPAAAVCKRRDHDASPRPLSSHRPGVRGALEERLGLAAIARAGGMESKPGDRGPAIQSGGAAQVRAYFAEARAPPRSSW